MPESSSGSPQSSESSRLHLKDLLNDQLPWWAISARGLGMGAADVVPGVSGGTMALILGVYDRFINALSSLKLGLLKSAISARHKENRPAFYAAIREADVMFLVFLGLGIVTAIASFAKVIPWLLDHYPAQMNGFFFGMILASTAIPFRMMTNRGALQLISFVVSTAFAFWFSGLPLLAIDASMPFLFMCGAIAICAMMLPGVSGSFLLLILGQYKYVLSGLRDFNLPIILVFSSGCAFGLLAFSRVLSWLLKNHHSTTLAALCGLMLGSLQKLWPFKDIESRVMVGKKLVSAGTNVLPWSEAHASPVPIVIGLMVFGMILIFVLEKIGSAKKTA
jgi:putative membrane protein